MSSVGGRVAPQARAVRIGGLRWEGEQALLAFLILFVALLSVVHILGLGPGRVVQNLLGGLKVAGNPIKLSGHADAGSRGAVPDLDADRARITRWLDGG